MERVVGIQERVWEGGLKWKVNLQQQTKRTRWLERVGRVKQLRFEMP